MKQAFILALSLVALFGCDRHQSQPQKTSDREPSVLQPAEQIQVLIFKDLAFHLIGRGDGEAAAIPLFLCLGDPQGDPSRQVLTYVSQAYHSVRPCSVRGPRGSFGNVTERGTGFIGVELRIEPFSISNDGPVTIQASYYFASLNAAGYEYKVNRVNGVWQILESILLWIA